MELKRSIGPSENTRLWVYQANRKLKVEEEILIDQAAVEFTSRWQAHGQPLKASYWIGYHHFLVLTVDESFHQASGCSIDASVAFIRQLEEKLNLSFLDRSKIAVLKNEEIKLFDLSSIKTAVSAGQIEPQDIVFNNSVSNYADWVKNWKIPAAESWMKRYFSTTMA